MFFLKKEDRPGRAPPQAAPHSARWSSLRRLGGLNPLGNSRGFRSWRVLGPILMLSYAILAHLGLQDASKSLQDASKTPSRPSRTPPRASKTSKTPPAGGPKPLFFLVFFNVFAFQSYLDPTRPPRRLQEPSGRLQDAFKNLKDPSKSFQDAPKTFRDGTKTPPESAQNQKNKDV